LYIHNFSRGTKRPKKFGLLLNFSEKLTKAINRTMGEFSPNPVTLPARLKTLARRHKSVTFNISPSKKSSSRIMRERLQD
jgi:hypothetical protein